MGILTTKSEENMKTIVIFCACFLASSFWGAATAQAGWVIEGSVGKGGRVNEPKGWEPTNVMVAPGYQFLGILRAQLGLAADLGDVKSSKFDLQLRPMLGVYPPIIPLYARAIFAIQSLLHSPRHVAVGGAVGIKLGLPLIGLGVFAEVGLLPRFVNSTTQTIVEGRLGAFWVF
jgi:hypothetical protein